MTADEYRALMAEVAYFAGCAVKQQIPDVQRAEVADKELLFKAAQDHQLAAAVGMALEKAGVKNTRFSKAAALAQRKNALLDADCAAVTEWLENAGIWYVPLKGAVLKDLYPRLGMREMTDVDILFEAGRAEDVKQIMLTLGFSIDEYGLGNHDIYSNDAGSIFELHRELFRTKDDTGIGPYYSDVKGRLVREDGKEFGFRFTDEDLYLYLTAHEYKHYYHYGTGLRSLLDIYVFLNKKQLDMEYVLQEAGKMGISDFERKNRALAIKLCDGGDLTPDEEKMLDNIYFSGTYGNPESQAKRQISEKGRLAYFRSRLFPTVDELAVVFPSVKRFPFLYPLCWVLRMLRGAFFRKEYLRAQLKALLRKDK